MFSVVIPLYNKGHTIADTLKSVLSQDFVDFEVIIVDDGSTDDGPDKVQQFDDPRIRLIRQENRGEGFARNRGIEAARYDLIASLDADDFWLPQYLTEVLEAVNEYPDAGMICCGGASLSRDGSGLIRQSRVLGARRQRVDFFDAPFFFGNASSTVFSKKIASAVGGFPTAMRHHADVVFFFKLALKAHVVFCPALVSVYNHGIPGQVIENQRANLSAIIESSNRIYEFWDSLDPEEKDPKCVAAVLDNMRAGFRLLLAGSDYELIDDFFEKVDPRLVRRLSVSERFLYRRPRLRPAALVRSRATGLRRRVTRRPTPRFSRDVMNEIVDSGYVPAATWIRRPKPENA